MSSSLSKAEAIGQLIGGVACILLWVVYNILYWRFFKNMSYSYKEGIKQFYYGKIVVNSCNIPLSASGQNTVTGQAEGLNVDPGKETIHATSYTVCNKLDQDEVNNYKKYGGGELIGISKGQNVDPSKITKTFTIHPTIDNFSNWSWLLPGLSILVLVLSWIMLGTGILLLYSAIHHYFN